MSIEFKKVPPTWLVLKNGVEVATIKVVEAKDAPLDWGCRHYALTYVSGRIDRHSTFDEARDDALKI